MPGALNGMGRGCRCSTTLDDVLLALSTCLHHLVDGSVLAAQVLVAELVGHLVDDLGLLVREQFAVIATVTDKLLAAHNDRDLIDCY